MIGGYYANPYLLNPAEAGSGDQIRLFGHYRNQYADFEGAPVTQIFTADGFIPEKKFGLGLQVFNDQTNVIDHTGFSLAYAYRLDLNERFSVRLGLAANLSQRGVDFNKMELEEDNEQGNLAGVQQNTLFDGDAGLAFHYDRLQVGFAVPQLLETTTDYSDALDQTDFSYRNQRQYLLQAGYDFPINEQFDLRPTVISRLSRGFTPQYEGIVAAGYQRKYYLMLGYRSQYAMTAGASFQISDAIMAGYSYDLPTNELQGFTSGSHEVMLGITLSELFNGASNRPDTGAVSRTAALENEVREQTMRNIRLREEIEAYRAQVRKERRDLVHLDSLKQQSKAIARGQSELKPAPGDDTYVVVLGAFRNIENVIAFQRLRKRLGQEGATRVKQTLDGSWNLVYESAYGQATDATARLVEAREQQPALFEKPWIYVEPRELPQKEAENPSGAQERPQGNKRVPEGLEMRELPEDAFTIQVASFSRFEVSLSRFRELLEVADVYQKKPENGSVVVRLGPFENQQEAQDALKRARQAGYQDAFMTRETGGQGAYFAN